MSRISQMPQTSDAVAFLRNFYWVLQNLEKTLQLSNTPKKYRFSC